MARGFHCAEGYILTRQRPLFVDVHQRRIERLLYGMCGRTREGERENCPASGIIASLQLATVRLYDDPADRQSNTEAARLRGHKGSNSFSRISCGSPGPVSEMLTSIIPSEVRFVLILRANRSRSAIASMALRIRLNATCSICTRSKNADSALGERFIPILGR